MKKLNFFSFFCINVTISVCTVRSPDNAKTKCIIIEMSVYHDEVEIEDMEYDEEKETYYYPCPCSDKFEITKVCFCIITRY